MKLLSLIFLLCTTALGQTTRPDIQAAIDNLPVAGGVVNLPSGDYVISAPITIARPNVTIRGRGRVTVTASASLPETSRGHMIFLQGAKHTTIKGISFNANATARGGFAGDPQTILVNWSDDTTIDSCTFANAVCDDIFAWGGAGCTMPPCVGLTVSNCTFGVAQRNNISPINVRRCTIIGNTFAGKNLNDPFSCIDAEPNWPDPFGCEGDLTIIKNKFTNVVRAVYAQNINHSGPSGIWFQGNTVTGAVYGFENQWAMGDVSGNMFTNITGMAIVTGSYTAGSLPVQIHDNTFSGCAATIVQADAGHDVVGANAGN